MSEVGFNLDSLPHCCGAWELGNINDGEFNEYTFDLDSDGDFVSWLRSEAAGRPVFINFVQNRTALEGKFAEKYEAQELMDAIAGKEHVVDLGTWINPGSGNRIHAFMVKGTAHEA